MNLRKEADRILSRAVQYETLGDKKDSFLIELGTDTDLAIARRYGLSRRFVQETRGRLGIEKRKSRRTVGAVSKFTPEIRKYILENYQTLTNSEMAKQLDVYPITLARWKEKVLKEEGLYNTISPKVKTKKEKLCPRCGDSMDGQEYPTWEATKRGKPKGWICESCAGDDWGVCFTCEKVMYDWEKEAEADCNELSNGEYCCDDCAEGLIAKAEAMRDAIREGV